MMTTNEIIRHLERDHGVTCPKLSPSWGIRMQQVRTAHDAAHEAGPAATHTHPQSRSAFATYHPRFLGEKVGGAF